MATEKRKVNLVNLKTKFGQYLNKYYACQNCHSIDKLALGFNCEHKFCVDCNDGQLDYCKECKEEIENHVEDGFQNSLMPHFEDLKSIMGIDLKKIAAKQKQLNDQQKLQERTVNKEQQNEENEPDKRVGQIEENKQDNQDVEPAETENEDVPVASKSKKQSKKASESKKNASNTEADQAEDHSSLRSTRSTRESNRSKEKKLMDIVKESTTKPEAAVEDKPASKSLRKTDKSTKANSTVKHKQMVIIATSITENEIKKLDKFAKKFNAKVVNEFTDEITHLVALEAKPDLTTRTLKYLKSLLTHKWLLSFNWVLESLKNDKLVDESDYELLGITKQIEANLGAPKRSRENQIQIFENKQFLLDGKFKMGLSRKDYEDLIVIGGGELVDEKDVNDDVYVVIEAGFKSAFKGRKNSFTTTDLLNYVSNFEFDL